MAYELRLDGAAATGLACALATRARLPVAAFKMAHPLEWSQRASVLMQGDADADKQTVAAAAAAACADVGADLRGLLAQLPPDPHAKERLWPERRAATPLGVQLRPRAIDEEA